MNAPVQKFAAVNKGFTLIELIIYLVLLAIFMSGAILFSWDIILSRVKSSIQQEVNQNLRFSAKRILTETRYAKSIVSVAADKLCLESVDRGPLTFFLTSGTIMIGWGTNCETPDNVYSLTSNLIKVDQLEFTNLSSGNSKNIAFTITISSSGDKKEWEKTQTYTTSAELRKMTTGVSPVPTSSPSPSPLPSPSPSASPANCSQYCIGQGSASGSCLKSHECSGTNHGSIYECSPPNICCCVQ